MFLRCRLLLYYFLGQMHQSMYVDYRAYIFGTKKFCCIKRPYFLMQYCICKKCKIWILNFVKTTMLDITTKIQHKMGFVITNYIAGFKSVWNKVYSCRETLQEISSGQIGYCAFSTTSRTKFLKGNYYFTLQCNGSKNCSRVTIVPNWIENRERGWEYGAEFELSQPCAT